jgi:hypothetical protein
MGVSSGREESEENLPLALLGPQEITRTEQHRERPKKREKEECCVRMGREISQVLQRSKA